MKIYFAASIRAGRGDKDLYMNIIKHLQNYGEVLTEHIGDIENIPTADQDKTDQFIYERDMDWVKEADIVVAEVTQPSLGVGYEIGWQKERSLLFVYIDNKKGKDCLPC